MPSENTTRTEPAAPPGLGRVSIVTTGLSRTGRTTCSRGPKAVGPARSFDRVEAMWSGTRAWRAKGVDDARHAAAVGRTRSGPGASEVEPGGAGGPTPALSGLRDRLLFALRSSPPDGAAPDRTDLGQSPALGEPSP